MMCNWKLKKADGSPKTAGYRAHLYTGTFRPWRVQDDKCVVSSVTAWSQPVWWNDNAPTPAPRVLCSETDIFADETRPFMDSNYGWLCKQVREPGEKIDRLVPTLAIDVVRRMFRLIDETPRLDWMLKTSHPERVREVWRQVTGRPADGEYDSYRRNVWIGVAIGSQAEANSRIRRLVECRDLAPRVFLDLTLTEGVELSFLPSCDLVMVGGAEGLNTVEWVRDVFEQCKASGVPCYFKATGKFVGDAELAERE